jgi:hypothetical protein
MRESQILLSQMIDEFRTPMSPMNVQNSACSRSNTPVRSELNHNYVTRAGRTVNKPRRLNL